MPLTIIRQDITTMRVDAIVDPSNTALFPGGGTDKAIHKAAGAGLAEECAKLGGCRPGEAKITKAFRLPCKYVIFTAGPAWNGGANGEETLLAECYKSCLQKAEEYRCASVAFPLISSGALGFPKDRVLRVAVNTVSEFLSDHEMDVTIAVYDKNSFSISEKLFSAVQSYIDDHYVEEHSFTGRTAILCDTLYPSVAENKNLPSARREKRTDPATQPETTFFDTAEEYAGEREPCCFPASAVCDSVPKSLDELITQVDESFSQMLLRKIDEKGMKDSECYKKANIDRKLFSKIRSNTHYRPKKNTALAFAVALELSIEETRELLMKAGYALSRSDKGDIITEYFITNGIYDIFEINEVLFRYDQLLLGT